MPNKTIDTAARNNVVREFCAFNDGPPASFFGTVAVFPNKRDCQLREMPDSTAAGIANEPATFDGFGFADIGTVLAFRMDRRITLLA